MRKTSPLQWIEEREARYMLATAEFARAPSRGASSAMLARCTALGTAAAAWLARFATCVAAANPALWPLMQAQPVLIRRPTRAHLHDRDDGYFR